MESRPTMLHSDDALDQQSERQPLLGAANLHADRTRTLGDEDNLISSPASIMSLGHEMSQSVAPRVCAVMFCSFIVGMHTAVIGVLIPHIELYYGLTDLTVSLIFLLPLIGYLSAALLNNAIHIKYGRIGIAIMGPLCYIPPFFTICFHPPYSIVLVCFIVAGFGTGLVDSAWCGWAGGLPRANTIQGFLHGSFSVGATFGPWLATILIAKWGQPWYSYYYFMTVAATLELAVLSWLFRKDDYLQYAIDKDQELSVTTNSHMKEALKYNTTWICALYFLAYVGAETAVSGWVVTFMLRVRFSTPQVAGMCASAFWTGMALGRVLLGFVTERCGEKLSVAIYLVLALVMEVIFSLVKNIPISVISITLLGLFLGPVYPTGIVMVTKILPRRLHISAVAFVSALGQIGGAGFPFFLGWFAQQLGIGVFREVIFGLLILVTGFWLLFPQPKKTQSESTQEGVTITTSPSVLS